MAGVAAVVGLGSSLYSAFSGSNSQPSAPSSFQMPNMGDAANGAFGGASSLGQYNLAGGVIPQYQQAFNTSFSNPYADLYQQRSNDASNIGWGTGLAQTGAGNQLMGAGLSLLPGAQSILQTAFDPQNALHDRTQQQLTDSTRAGLTARGIGMSPYGAGVENKALSDFNIDWQNNLLNRMNTGAQGAGYLTNAGANATNLGQNVGTLGLNTLQNSGALPYNTTNTIGNNMFGALNQYGQGGVLASQVPQMQIGDFLQYLSAGNQAGGVANSGYANQVTAQNNAFNQQQTTGRNIGSSLQGLGTAYPSIGTSIRGLFG